MTEDTPMTPADEALECECATLMAAYSEARRVETTLQAAADPAVWAASCDTDDAARALADFITSLASVADS